MPAWGDGRDPAWLSEAKQQSAYQALLQALSKICVLQLDDRSAKFASFQFPASALY
jgi:hypothetical protein